MSFYTYKQNTQNYALSCRQAMEPLDPASAYRNYGGIKHLSETLLVPFIGASPPPGPGTPPPFSILLFLWGT